MKNTALLLIIITFLASCNSDQETSNYVTLNGNIEGLKVGTIILQKVQDSTLITLDSVQLNGTSKFTLKAPIEEPALMFLHLDVKDGLLYDDRVSIFVEDTILTVSSTLEDFEKNIKVTGSKNNDILDGFKVNKKLLDQVYTDLLKRSMLLDREESPSQVDVERLNTDYNKYLKKTVLYVINYADRFKDKEVAAYLLVTEAFDANPILLENVYQKMPKKIQNSHYGKQLSELIKTSKEVNGL
jgi:hypothetical protein